MFHTEINKWCKPNRLTSYARQIVEVGQLPPGRRWVFPKGRIFRSNSSLGYWRADNARLAIHGMQPNGPYYGLRPNALL